MKSNPHRNNGRTATLACAGLIGALLFSGALLRVPAQTVSNSPAAAVVAAEATNTATADKPPGATNAASADEITVSFQNAPIDMVVQWLAQTTGKSVIKHKEVNCQLTIVSSKKVTTREALNLVYRALQAEGYSTVETSTSVLIVPEAKEPKMNPELLEPTRADIPQGRQRLMKMFPLAHAQAADLREKIRAALSDKGTIDSDDRANQLVVTDYNDNLRVVTELIKQFDVTSESDMTVKVYSVNHGDAEEMGNLLSMILNSLVPPTGAPGAAGRSPASSSSSGSRPSGVTSMPGSSPSPDMSSAASGGGGGTQLPQPQIRIWPDKTSNRLIVSAQKSKLPELERLLEILDTDKPRDVTVRVLTLKNVNAMDLQRAIGPMYQRLGARSPKDMVDVTADDLSNSLIILSSEANFNSIKSFVSSLDTEDAQDKVMRTFPLKNADAQDVAKQLQDLQDAGANRNSSSYTVNYYYAGSSTARNKKMNIVADRRRNAVIVQASPSQLESVEKMIKELDEPVSDEMLAPKIYHLKYVSAVDIEDVLNQLFLKKSQERGYYDVLYEIYGGSSSSSGSGDVGRLFGKVRITSEPFSNSLIVTANSKENLDAIENVINQLDQPSEAGESTLRVGLKFAKASTVANSINILFAKNGSPPLRQTNPQGPQGGSNPPQQSQQQASASQSGFELEQQSKEEGYYPWLGGQPDVERSGDGRSSSRPVSDLVGRVRAVADERSNAVMISANVHFFPQVLKMIEDFDAETDQVLIEARIVEVSSDFMNRLGVRWSPDGTQFNGDDLDNSLIAKGGGNYQKGFGGTTIVNTPASAGTVAQAITSLRSGVLTSSINMDFLVQFLRKTTDATVLAAPQISIRNNETARLFVGQQVPILTASQNSGSIGLSQNFIYKNVGVILEVTPRINNKGDVELRVHAESSTVVPGETILGGAVFDSRAFKTDLRARNGQTLVLGGIIQKQVTDTMRKTPILGSIPGLGWAFKKKDKGSHEVELMVFLRPKVVRTDEDAKALMDEADRNAPRMKKWLDDNQPPNKAVPSSQGRPNR